MGLTVNGENYLENLYNLSLDKEVVIFLHSKPCMLALTLGIRAYEGWWVMDYLHTKENYLQKTKYLKESLSHHPPKPYVLDKNN